MRAPKDKMAILALVIAILAVAGWLALRNPTAESVSGALRRLDQARAGAGAERLIEGEVAAGETLRTPSGAEAVAFATWTQVRSHSSWRLVSTEKLRFEWRRFAVKTREGDFDVDGRIVGLSDLVRRERGPEGEVEALIAPGARVAVLGVVSERGGRRGFFGEVIVVAGTFDEWRKTTAEASLGSIPDQVLTGSASP